MTADPEHPPFAVPAQELALGEDPALGTPIAPAMPGRGRGEFPLKLLLYALLLAIALFYLLPFAWAVSTSFKTLPESVEGFVLIPHHPTLAGYREAFTAGPFGRRRSRTRSGSSILRRRSRTACRWTRFSS